MNIGTRIKTLRTQKKWNQSELGEKLGLGFGAISSFENGKNNPSIEIVEKLSIIFGVSTDYLITGKEGTNEISEQEREILSVLREDKAMTNAMMEVAKVKKKAISFTRSYAAANQNVAMS